MAITIDGSTGWTYSDNIKQKFGTGDDLEIYHSGSHSYVNQTGTGDLFLKATSSGGDVYVETATNGCFVVQDSAGEVQSISCANGAFSAYYDNSKKFETTSDGVNVSGQSHIINSGGNAKLTLRRSNTASNTDDYGTIRFQSSAEDNNVVIGGARESAENDGYLFISTSSSGTTSERLRIDSSGRILAGTTSVGWDGADDLTVYNSGNSGITIRSGDDDLGTLAFADGPSGVDGYRGWVQYKQSSEYMTIGTNGTQRLRVDSDGLKFGSDTAAANALADYEEGTFTATIGTSGSAVTISGTSSWTGQYVKVGKLCHVHVYITVVVTDEGSGWMSINGLPFTSDSNTYSCISITHNTLTGQDAENGYVQPGNTIMYPVQENSTLATTPNDDGATRYLMFGGTYKTA